MALTDARDRLMEHPAVYAAWQAPFASQKFAPVERHLRGRQVRRVLDVGCGTGTNAGRFEDIEYVGVDINERYLRMARARYSGTFVQADLTTSELDSLGTFDTILVNSFLHHVADEDVRAILSRLTGVLATDGRVHILELVLPPHASLARMMARLDRGRYARPIESWCDLFGAVFEPVIAEPFTFGGGLWAMVYFQGRARQ
jgi:SAM-dependent methyltransferase